MDSFTSMKTKLDSLGLYKIEYGANVYAELKAYAAGLDIVFEELDKMLSELFIDTAQDYGLSCRELLLGKEKTDFSIEKRREMLKIYEQMMQGNCNPYAFEMIVRGYGIDNFEIVENPNDYTLNLNITDNVVVERRAYIAERVEADFPAHITVNINYL